MWHNPLEERVGISAEPSISTELGKSPQFESGLKVLRDAHGKVSVSVIELCSSLNYGWLCTCRMRLHTAFQKAGDTIENGTRV